MTEVLDLNIFNSLGRSLVPCWSQNAVCISGHGGEAVSIVVVEVSWLWQFMARVRDFGLWSDAVGIL